MQVGSWGSNPDLLHSEWASRVPRPAEQLLDVGFGRNLCVLSGRVADSELGDSSIDLRYNNTGLLTEAVWLDADAVLQTAGGCHTDCAPLGSIGVLQGTRGDLQTSWRWQPNSAQFI